MDLKRSNNNKLIKKKKSIFFFFFFFEIYTQKNPQTIFIFTTRSIASKPNVLYPIQVTDSFPPFFQNTRIYIYIYVYVQLWWIVWKLVGRFVKI